LSREASTRPSSSSSSSLGWTTTSGSTGNESECRGEPMSFGFRPFCELKTSRSSQPLQVSSLLASESV
jgi:hypothetical protein